MTMTIPNSKDTRGCFLKAPILSLDLLTRLVSQLPAACKTHSLHQKPSPIHFAPKYTTRHHLYTLCQDQEEAKQQDQAAQQISWAPTGGQSVHHCISNCTSLPRTKVDSALHHCEATASKMPGNIKSLSPEPASWYAKHNPHLWNIHQKVSKPTFDASTIATQRQHLKMHNWLNGPSLPSIPIQMTIIKFHFAIRAK